MTYTPETATVQNVYAHNELSVIPRAAGQKERTAAWRRGWDEFDRWLADHDAKVRADERAKVAAAIRAERAATCSLDLDVDAWHCGMADAAKIAERAS